MDLIEINPRGKIKIYWLRDPIDTFQNIRDQTTICHFHAKWCRFGSYCLLKTGSTGENPAGHGHYTHDAAMISRLHDAHHFWRQGHQTFSGFIKTRERPQKRGGTETKEQEGRTLETKKKAERKKKNRARRE